MQSGISASSELHEAFRTLTSTPSTFALPITITSEQLTPLNPIPYASSSDFYASLASLSPLLTPKDPLYILIRAHSTSSSATNPDLYALTYIPSTAGVRSKTLFASTRATLVRELGLEKFKDTVFCTDADEVVSQAEWKGRLEGSDGGEDAVRHSLLGEQERELEMVKRAEEEARHGTVGRDVGIGGTVGGGGSAGASSGSRMQLKIQGQAKAALRALNGKEGSGAFVQLAMDVPTEEIQLVSEESSVTPSALGGKIPDASPSYTFYQYPESTSLLFIYTCPSTSSIKERMVYASSRNGVILSAGDEGLTVTKKLETSSPDEFTEERLREEVHGAQEEGVKKGFARPKRPGRR